MDVRSFFIHFSDEGHLGGFQFWWLRTKLLSTFHGQIFVGASGFVSLGQIPRSAYILLLICFKHYLILALKTHINTHTHTHTHPSQTYFSGEDGAQTKAPLTLLRNIPPGVKKGSLLFFAGTSSFAEMNNYVLSI